MKSLSKNLYVSKCISEHKWEVTLASEEHAVFKAHFEGNPLLPAFLQIDIFAELIDKKIVKIERCKFKQPILPNDIVVYEVIKQVDDMYRIKIFKKNEITSEIKIVCTPYKEFE
jgi:3-hydroxyacyl-[acyl-carrier-protein] dehydratase